MALAALTAALGALVPVYTDEINWKVATHRLLLDGFRITYNFPQCTGFALPPPPLLVPGALLDAFMVRTLRSPVELRVAGLLSCVLSLAGMAALARRAWACTWLTAAASITAAATLGVLPLMLVLDRPEQGLVVSILLCVGAAIALPPRVVVRYRTLLAAGHLLVFTCALAHSPRALFFTPVYLVAGWLSTTGRWRAVFVAVALAAAAQTHRFWTAHLICPEEPELAAAIGGVTLSPSAALADPWRFLRELCASIAGSWRYVEHTTFARRYTANWLPSAAETGAPGIVNAGIGLSWAVILAVAAAGTAMSWRADRAARRLSPASAILGALLFSVAGFCAMQRVKLFYGAAIVLPVVLLSATLAAPHLFARVSRPARRGLLLALFVASAASQTALLALGRRWAGTWTQPGSPAGQPLSVSVVGYGQQRARILALASRCGISPAGAHRHLLLDELTLYPFWQSPQPYQVFYVSPVYDWGGSHPDLLQILARGGSTGVVAQCRGLPRELTRLGVSDEGLCCVPASRLGP